MIIRTIVNVSEKMACKSLARGRKFGEYNKKFDDLLKQSSSISKEEI
jgi:hypothetical protein